MSTLPAAQQSLDTRQPVDVVLVGALHGTERAAAVLAALGGLPARLQVVLRGSYLEGRADEDLAAQLLLTPAELGLVRHDALRALGRTGVTRPRRSAAAAPSPYTR